MEHEILDLGGKRFFIKKAPATVAYEIALRYRKALETKNVEEMQTCLYMLCKYIEVDLGDGRRVALDNQTIIDQHLTSASDLIALQKTAVKANFGFFDKDAD